MLLTLDSGNFYMQMASEADPESSLRLIGEHLQPHQRIFIGVIDVVNEKGVIIVAAGVVLTREIADKIARFKLSQPLHNLVNLK